MARPLPTTPTASDDPASWRVWGVIVALTLLWHLVWLRLPRDWAAPLPPPRIEVQQVDPAKLDAIRRQWKRDREKQLLLNKDKSAPKEKEAPEDARYMSDRNIRVEREQRAKDTNVIPRPGSRQQAQPESPPDGADKPSSSVRRGRLGNLGVPLRLDAPPTPKSRPRAAPAVPDGGDQALLDKNLPEGSENLLNAQESVYYSFYARLYETIGPIWQSRVREVPTMRRVRPGEYSTVVDVVFDRDGNLLEIRRIQSSGVLEFDQAVDLSWRKIGRFPNPPHGLLDDSGKVHTGWTFTVTVGAGFNLDYLPPERNY
jgi:outer membrane biosynthesis protein TonB